jgi:hypothetical protein
MRVVFARALSKPHTMNKAIVWSKIINNDLTLLGRVYRAIVPRGNFTLSLSES